MMVAIPTASISKNRFGENAMLAFSAGVAVPLHQASQQFLFPRQFNVGSEGN
jgi:hypothetical protein